jgi:hypothetical protein
MPPHSTPGQPIVYGIDGSTKFALSTRISRLRRTHFVVVESMATGGEPGMRESLIFSVSCQTLGLTVELQTRNWYVEIDGENEVIQYRARCECGKEHFGFSTRFPGQRQPSEIRAYVSNSFEEMWQYPAREQLFSECADGGYVCMTSGAINMWREGKLSSCAHNAETRARYNSLLQRGGA